MSWIHEEPKRERSWGDILDHGVIYPHPESSKGELQQWILTHAKLLSEMRGNIVRAESHRDMGIDVDKLVKAAQLAVKSWGDYAPRPQSTAGQALKLMRQALNL